jgi:hypothetical protein
MPSYLMMHVVEEPDEQDTDEAAPASWPPAPPAPRVREETFPLSTRVAEDVMDLLDAATQTGVTQRAAIEYAIRNTYG